MDAETTGSVEQVQPEIATPSEPFVSTETPRSEEPPFGFEVLDAAADDGDDDEAYNQAVSDGSYDDEIKQACGDGEELESLVGRFGDRVYKVLGIQKPAYVNPYLTDAELESMVRVFSAQNMSPAALFCRDPQPLDGCFDLTHVVEPGLVRAVPDDVTDAVLATLKSVTADVDVELESIQERRGETMREIVLRIVVRRAYAKAKGAGAEKFVAAVRDSKLDSYIDVVKAAIDVLDKIEDLLGASDPTLRVTLRKLQIRKEKEYLK